MPRARRRLSVLTTGILVLAAALVGVAPASADHTDTPSRVTLMGTLMSELGCPADWSEDCTATDLLPVAGSEKTSVALGSVHPDTEHPIAGLGIQRAAPRALGIDLAGECE